jgi:outer membrane lipoprotein-sorting protein
MSVSKACNRLHGRTTALAVALACLIAAPAFAQNIPLPAKRPNTGSPAITGTVQAPKSALDARAQAPQQQTPAANNPFAALLNQPGTTRTLTPEQRAIVIKVNTYLSSVQVMSGQFVQVGPDGGRTQGNFYISKPGKVRFEYDPPSPIDIVSNGTDLVVRDRNLATQDLFPLSQTPLRFLLADRVDLLKDTNLVALYTDDVFVTVVLEEKNGIAGTSRLMIMFDAKDMSLKQWTVTDPQGYDTTVAVYNLDNTRKPDPSLFRIDYSRNDTAR